MSPRFQWLECQRIPGCVCKPQQVEGRGLWEGRTGGGGGDGDVLRTREDLRGEASPEEVAGVEGSVERPEGVGMVGPWV